MRAVIYREFRERPTLEIVPDPVPDEGGVVLEVKACGICRSDWHGWMGADPDVKLPHVPGHELAGVVAEVGGSVKNWKPGDRVTVPFVCGCGECVQCLSGNQQICDRQFQPGFTHWGGFARYVAINYADGNLVRLPDDLDFVTSASLGCRFATAFRAVADQGRVKSGEWVAVHGCGGVGLSAIMISSALGANVVAVDLTKDKLDMAASAGASELIDASVVRGVSDAIRGVTGGGADVSIDAIGHPAAVMNSVKCLRKRGRHIQVGLFGAENPAPQIPLDLIVANELEILGSHGMQAHRYPEMLAMIGQGRLDPAALVGKRVTLGDSVGELVGMERFNSEGVTVIDRF